MEHRRLVQPCGGTTCVPSGTARVVQFMSRASRRFVSPQGSLLPVGDVWLLWPSWGAMRVPARGLRRWCGGSNRPPDRWRAEVDQTTRSPALRLFMTEQSFHQIGTGPCRREVGMEQGPGDSPPCTSAPRAVCAPTPVTPCDVIPLLPRHLRRPTAAVGSPKAMVHGWVVDWFPMDWSETTTFWSDITTRLMGRHRTPLGACLQAAYNARHTPLT